jgi:hypothetical protein
MRTHIRIVEKMVNDFEKCKIVVGSNNFFCKDYIVIL